MNRQLFLTPIFGALFLGAVVCSAAQEQKDKGEKEKPSPNYYPMQVGNEWSYKVSTGENNAIAIARIARLDILNEIPLHRLEASVNERVVATEHLRQTSEGIFRYRNNGEEISPPVCLLKYPAKSGTKWQGDMKVGDEKIRYTCESTEENVTVPAGSYKAMRVSMQLESKGQVVKLAYWFVADVGYVKHTRDATDLSFVMALEKFTPAKEKVKAN